jgi:triosephosphate isomerase (TIM)
VGETLEERDKSLTEKVVESHVRGAYAGITADDAVKTVIAYEPVWAIGTGRAATAEGAGGVIHNSIRGTVATLYGEPVAQSVRVQYGGSMTKANVGEFMVHQDIDGGLVGGACLKPADFMEIVRIAGEAKK